MSRLIFISPPEALHDPDLPATQWRLTLRGRRRADRFARSAEAQEITAIWSAPARRAIETAALLSARRSVCLRTDPLLADPGGESRAALHRPAEAATVEALLPRRAAAHRAVTETLPEAQARIVSALADLVAAHRGGDIAIVAHGTLGALLRCHLLARPICRDAEASRPGFHWTADLSASGRPEPWRPIDGARPPAPVRLADPVA